VSWWLPVTTVPPGEGGDVGLPSAGSQAVLTGSHLDSVRDGGAYDGPLGVVSALAAFDVLRDQGFRPSRPLGIAVFAEEEGSRFPLACLGSRLASATLPWERARALKDRDGVALGDVVEGDGSDLLRDVGVYVELHVEQGRDLVERGAPVGVASAIWPHGRYRMEFTGAADHAGTTRMEDRHDPMLTYAMTVLAANKQARLSGRRATFGRVSVDPGSTNGIPSRVTGWLDARAADEDLLDDLVGEVTRLASERAGRDGTRVDVVAESTTPEVMFDSDLARRLAGPDRPIVPTAAGHDAGILQAAGIPTAMLFVRNPTGVSHSPAEHAETEDCLAGVDALAGVLADLAGEPP